MKTITLLLLIISLNSFSQENDIVYLYSQYKQECYNDSTKQIVGSGNVTCYPTNPPFYKYEFYDTIYIHKQPSSLEDFMKYCENNPTKAQVKKQACYDYRAYYFNSDNDLKDLINKHHLQGWELFDKDIVCKLDNAILYVLWFRKIIKN